MRTLSRLTTNHPKSVLALTGVLVVVAAAVGITALPKLTSAGYNDPNSQSQQVSQRISDVYGDETPHLTLMIGKRGQAAAVDSPEVAAAADDVAAQVAAAKGVTKVVSYWNTGGAQTLRSGDGGLGLMLVYLDDAALDQRNVWAKAITDELPSEVAGVTVLTAGTGPVYNAINGQITSDLTQAELISIPLTLLMLLVVFGSAMAAAQPLIVGLSAIGLSLLGVWALTFFTDISVFSLNLLTGLGLGLGIDYSLLIISRFREELARGVDPIEAVANTVHTAGRTVMFSGVTVALTLAGMFVFPQPFLRSFAYAGLLVCVLAVFGALVPLPAMLRLLGPRIDRFRVRRRIPTPTETGRWSDLARAVMRRPLLTIAATLAVLLSLAGLARSAVFGQVDFRVLPVGHPVVASTETFEEDFGGNSRIPIELLLPTATPAADAERVARDTSTLVGVVRVATADGMWVDGQFQPMPAGWTGVQMAAGDTQRLTAYADVESRGSAAEELVKQIRALDPQLLVGGSAAEYTDAQQATATALPWALLWVAAFTLLLLFLFTGSVVLPIKAVLLNLLSLGATLGVLTWLFQNGNLQWLTGDYYVTGRLDLSTLVMIVLVTFGLSMDYEVFLLSRIKEEHDRGSNTEDSVAIGLQRSGRIITAAAAILAVVFAAFVTSGVTSIKMVGVGIGFAILLDATIVRGLLVPALMKVMGGANWWAPAPLRRLHNRFGLSD